jgi:MFS family permease
MSEKQVIKKKILKRLTPLYVAAFFQSFVLWYNIEKLFMRSIGFSNAAIGFMIAVYSAVMLLVDTPSGILADRWSRKGVLILASVCLSLTGLVGGLSHGIGVYLIAAMLWGVFFACYSGMYDSIVYDTVAEEGADNGLFESLFGRIQLLDGTALVIGGLVGGLIASQIGLRAAYFYSVPLGLIPILALLRFREPRLHKMKAVVTLKTQINSTIKALNNSFLFPVVMALILRSILIYCVFEFSQVWLLSLHTSTAYWGVANAVLLSSLAVGGFLVNRLKLGRHTPMLITLVTTLVACYGLIVFRSTATIVGSQFVFASGLICIFIVFSRILHDNLDSSIRAGAASATSTLGRFFIITTALLLGYVSQKFSIYKAAYILFVLTILMGLFVVVVAKRDNHTGLESK